MPRIGITEQQILAAIEALQAKGDNVSRITVRRELGDTGSFGTISAVLQRWRESQQQSQESLNALQPIPDSVQSLFAKAWSTAQAVAQAELVPQREALAQEAAGLRAVIEKAETENNEALRVLEIQIESLTAQLAEVSDREKETQTRLSKLAEDLGYYRGKLEASEAMMVERQAEKDARIKLLADSLTAATNLRKEMGLPTS